MPDLVFKNICLFKYDPSKRLLIQNQQLQQSLKNAYI